MHFQAEPKHAAPNAADSETTVPAEIVGARLTADRKLFKLPELAAETGVTRRFLEMEISRGHLVALKLSARVLRIRRADWERYLNERATGALTVGGAS